MITPVTIAAQAAATRLEALQFRGGLDRRRINAHASPRPRYNADLLPMEERHADELDTVAVTMTALEGCAEALQALGVAR